MPIVCRDVQEFTQTPETLHLRLALKGIPHKKVDVYLSDAYLKVNFSPFLFECDLHGFIDEEKSKVSIGGGMAAFELVKKDVGIWPELRFTPAAELTEEERKVEIKKRRDESIARLEQKQQQRDEDRKKAKYEEEQLMVKKLLEAEQAERERIQRLKQEEREQAENDLKQWREQEALKKQQSAPVPVKKSAPGKSIFEEGNEQQRDAAVQPDPVHGRVLPPPRARGTIKISFTQGPELPARLPATDEEKAQYEATRISV